MQVNDLLRPYYEEALKALPNNCDVKLVNSPIAESNFLRIKNAYDYIYAGDNKIEIVYHATDIKNALSIANNGFIDNCQEGYKMRLGNAYGPGVYVSRSFDFVSRNYYKGIMFTCLMVRGRCVPYNDLRPIGSKSFSKVNIHHAEADYDVIDCGNQMVVKSSVQVLPILAYTLNKSIKVTSLESLQLLNPSTDVQVEESKKLVEIFNVRPPISLNLIMIHGLEKSIEHLKEYDYE